VQRHAAFAIPLGAGDLAPFRRPELMILIPCAPRRIAFCIARFIARRNMIRFSSCCAIESAISCASSSGLRISSMLTCTGTPIIFCSCRPCAGLDVLALLADHDTRTRREDVMRAFLAGRSIRMRLTGSVRKLLLQVRANRVLLSMPAKFLLLAYQRDDQFA
jgi:hypothetical protein